MAEATDDIAEEMPEDTQENTREKKRSVIGWILYPFLLPFIFIGWVFRLIFSGWFFRTALKGLVAVAILLLGLTGYRTLIETAEVAEPQVSREVIHRVNTATVQHVDRRPVFVVYGRVAAPNQADLIFPVSGNIEWLSDGLNNGDYVEQGSLLARIDGERLKIARDDARSKLESVEGEFAIQQREFALDEQTYERSVAMHAEGLISNVAMETNRVNFIRKQTNIEKQRDTLNQARLAVQNAERNLIEGQLYAPFSGVISKVDAGIGQLVSPSKPIAVITDTTDLEVSFVVPSEIYAEAESLKGSDIEITWQSGGRIVSTVTGVITGAEGNFSSGDGGGRLYASLPGYTSIAEQTIPPGAFVSVRLPSFMLESIVVLPDTALFDEERVYVITPQGRSQARQVILLARSEGEIFVHGALNDGEQVITTRIPGLGDGLLIEAVN